MKLDDLKADWKNEITESGNNVKLTEVIEALMKETTKVDKSIKRRDILEISIALLLIPVWSWKLFYSAGVMQSLGLWIAILACIYIPYRLLKAKRVHVPQDESVLAYLEVEKLKLQNQKSLLETIALWYISPLMIAIVLITAGATVNDFGIPQIPGQLMVYYSFCALLVVGVYLLNTRAAKKKFQPLLDKVNQRISEINETSAQ